ncbi:MAG: aspartate aminotransferase family protein, partial [Acidimicrobiia bacterium]|nr:aspartate aminotransferase family protein [Acidimicrobiia bacterium]
IVVFERIGWKEGDYQVCTERLLADGTGFVVPSRHDGRPVFRFCFINPRTTSAEMDAILAAMA